MEKRDEIKEQIERFKIKAELFLKENKPLFIKDIYNTYYFCTIISIEEINIYVHNFKGKREGKNDKICWADIKSLKEYQPRIDDITIKPNEFKEV